MEARQLSERSDYRKLARGQACTLRVAGYMQCSNRDTVVLAHAPCTDKGMGVKSPDLWSAFACAKCHRIMDVETSMTKIEKKAAWFDAVYETQKALGVFK